MPGKFSRSNLVCSLDSLGFYDGLVLCGVLSVLPGCFGGRLDVLRHGICCGICCRFGVRGHIGVGVGGLGDLTAVGGYVGGSLRYYINKQLAVAPEVNFIYRYFY